MGTIVSLLKKLQTFNAEDIAEKAMQESKEALADYNAEQLNKGETSKGENLKSYRSEAYAEYKNNLNPLPGFGNPDLKLTGSFYRGIYVTVSGNDVKIDSTDGKAESLKKKYGDELIFGLNENFKEEFIRESLQPNFSKEVENVLGLKLT